MHSIFRHTAFTFGRMSFLEVSHISRQQDDAFIVKDISFTQQKLQKLAITGETGSGKSTLLKMIAGLVQPHEGEIRFENIRVEGPAEKLIPGHPGIAYLSQQFELPKFLRVEQALMYANKKTDAEAQTLYKICRITHLMKRRTNQLSGGEQQRIALARLLVSDPKLLLLDEPFSNLDMIHKGILKAVIRDIGEQLQVTCILISHDPLDTLSWADEILVLKEGELLQQGSPEQLYRQPADEYTAALLGKYNLISQALYEAFLGTIDGITSLKKIMVRPEGFQISKAEDSSVWGTIKNILFAGSGYEVEVQLLNEIVTIRTNTSNLSKGDKVQIRLQAQNVWFM